MDVFYSVGKNKRLLSCYEDEKGRVVGGWRIWALRAARIASNLLATLFVILVLIFSISSKHSKRFKPWKIYLWTLLAIASFILSFGIVEMLLGMTIKCPQKWAISYSLYNIFMGHLMLYAFVTGAHDVLYVYMNINLFSKKDDKTIIAFTTKAVKGDALFVLASLAVFFGFVTAVVHFVAAIWPPPYPPGVRGQQGGMGQKEGDVPKIQVTGSESETVLTNSQTTGTDTAGTSATATLEGESNSKQNIPAESPSVVREIKAN